MDDQDAGSASSASLSPNLLEFLGWVSSRPRNYAETMEAWRTSCPRLSVWEDATGDDLVRVEHASARYQGQAVVQLTERGAALFRRHGPAAGGSGSTVCDGLQ